MASSSNAYTDLLKKIYSTDKNKIEMRIKSLATQRVGWNGVFQTEKDIAERKFAEEHPELGEVCL